jgi:hypothetical protein
MKPNELGYERIVTFIRVFFRKKLKLYSMNLSVKKRRTDFVIRDIGWYYFRYFLNKHNREYINNNSECFFYLRRFLKIGNCKKRSTCKIRKKWINWILKMWKFKPSVEGNIYSLCFIQTKNKKKIKHDYCIVIILLTSNLEK